MVIIYFSNKIKTNSNSLVCLIRLYFLPDDEIKLPDNITYINDLAEVNKDYWMLELYTTWSPACQKVAPVFADLSRDYACDKLKFGKGSFSSNVLLFLDLIVFSGFRRYIQETSTQVHFTSNFKSTLEEIKKLEKNSIYVLTPSPNKCPQLH